MQDWPAYFSKSTSNSFSISFVFFRFEYKWVTIPARQGHFASPASAAPPAGERAWPSQNFEDALEGVRTRNGKYSVNGNENPTLHLGAVLFRLSSNKSCLCSI
jgi:hypothetical protein